MKKIICMLLITAMILSMMPFAMAEDEVEPTPDSTETFAYTRGDETVTEEVELNVKSVPTGEDAASDALIIETSITTTTTTGGSEESCITGKETDASIVDETAVVTQELSDDTIKTVTDEVECAIAGGSEECNHSWDEGEIVTRGSCAEHGVIRQVCQSCGAVKTTLTEMAHSWGDPVAVACAAKRYYICICTNCSETKIIYDDSIAPGKHQFKDGICTVCGDVEKTSGTIIIGEKDSVPVGPTYSFEDGKLTIGGEGGIPDYKITYEAERTTNEGTEKYELDVPVTEATPWADFAHKITNIIIGSGITRIGDFSFANLINLITVIIEGKNTEVGDYAFANDSNLADVKFTDSDATVTFDNSDGRVNRKESDGVEYEDVGSTAFLDDGNVSVNYSCINPNASSYETDLEFAFAAVCHNELHENCAAIPGYEPTEKEFGLTDGLHCRDCKKVLIGQYKIYPNGKEETGEYRINDFMNLKETGQIPESLSDKKYNSLEKIAELIDFYKNSLRNEFRTEFNTELAEDNYRIYDIELVESKAATELEEHIINIPYPEGTTPDLNEFVVVQLNEDDKIEKVDTFLTNKGIQIETEELMPVGVAWKNK